MTELAGKGGEGEDREIVASCHGVSELAGGLCDGLNQVSADGRVFQDGGLGSEETKRQQWLTSVRSSEGRLDMFFSLLTKIRLSNVIVEDGEVCSIGQALHGRKVQVRDVPFA